MDRVSFIILHYGNIEITKNCIDSIFKLSGDMDIHVVIVDNDWQKEEAERDKLQQMYAKNHKIDILRMHEDKGFSAANNEGYQYAKEKYHPDYVIAANNDIIFSQTDFLSKMKTTYAEEKFMVLGPDILKKSTDIHQNPIDTRARTMKQVQFTIFMNTVCLYLFELVYSFLIHFFDNRENQVKRDAGGTLLYDIVPCGACLIFSKGYISKEDKLFSPETKFYYEEYILHHNCMQKGYKIVYNPFMQVLHEDGGATNSEMNKKKDRIKFKLKHTLEAAKIYKLLIK